MTPVATPRTLSTADERREALVAAGMRVFARRGIAAPTTEIAREAGISQAYLFRLYPTKDDLLVAVNERCRERLVATFEAAKAQALASGEDPKEAMGRAYADLVRSDHDVLLCQLHAMAASPDHPVLRASNQETFRQLHAIVSDVLAPEVLMEFFAHGMLINSMIAIGADELDEPWTRALDCWSDPA